MSKWENKFVIGLTGKIGTGKSVVRKMLEHLGAYGIDADALSHRAISKSGPGFQPVIQTFGTWLVGQDGEIDRKKLARIVFNDPEALRLLEEIIHPLVGQAVDLLVKRCRQKVVVVEAIKLIETGMDQWCDSVWVTTSNQQVQLERLINRRGMTKDEAERRIAAQDQLGEQTDSDQVVIENNARIPDLWEQVNRAWKATVGHLQNEQANLEKEEDQSPNGELMVVRGKPQHAREIAWLLNQVRKADDPYLTEKDILAAFGEKAYFLMRMAENPVGLIGFQVENLVSRTHDLIIQPHIPMVEGLTVLVEEMEKASKELQCEAALIWLPGDDNQAAVAWDKLGYEETKPELLNVQAWMEAAREAEKPGCNLYFKKLRTDRVLRPI